MNPKIENKTKKRSLGFTLLEILVVVAVFGVLGVLVTRAIILSVGGSKKSESLVRVRENLDYAAGIIERQLRNANSVPQCPNSDPLVFNYEDQEGNATSFSCVDIGGSSGYVASGSAKLTSNLVNIVACSFSCQKGTGNNPSVVTVFLNAKDAGGGGVGGADVTNTIQVSLRNY